MLGMIMLAMMSVLGNAVIAQKKARDLFIEKEKNEEKGKSGVKFRILLKRGSQPERYVSPDEAFYSGDKIKLAFDINFSGYIALLNVGSSGKISLLYPYNGTDAAVEPSESEQLIPANNKDWISFDDHQGTEKITVVFSTNPIASVDDVVKMSKKANISVSGNITINTSSSEAQSLLVDLNSRSLKRAKSRDLSIQTVNDEATYVVAESSLISEPTAFIISLRHQ
jgi:hypothetical protein